jgi:hypothetical protein
MSWTTIVIIEVNQAPAARTNGGSWPTASVAAMRQFPRYRMQSGHRVNTQNQSLLTQSGHQANDLCLKSHSASGMLVCTRTMLCFTAMPDGISKAQPESKFTVVRGILWFLFLLSVWTAISLWPYWRTYGFGGPPKFDLAYALTLFLGPPIGVVVILILMFADVASRGSAFPRNIVTFVSVAIGMNIVGLILSYFVEPFGIRPLVVVSAIMIARNIMRTLMNWAHS